MNAFNTETFQKYVRKHTSKKSKSYDNTERKTDKKDSYKHVRSMKREWREE